ncbi:MAG TPA: hypothetical protein VEO20_02770 [Thermoplasmata archaeon]|nr:hypothetical protein [Thermoplasmata archaeon]
MPIEMDLIAPKPNPSGRLVRCRPCGATWSLGPLDRCPGCSSTNYSFVDRDRDTCPYCCYLPRGHSPSMYCTGDA